MPITFHCTCGQSITVPDQFAGKMGRCPGCKNPVQVPAAGAPVPAPPALGTPGAQPRPGTASRPAVVPPPAAASAAALSRSTQNAMAPGVQQGAPRTAPRPAVKVAAKLQVVNGPQSVVNRQYPLIAGKPNVIGRDPQVDIPIPSDRISRRHCQLEPTADGVFVLTDLGSSNGTLVNQERINGRKVLLGGEYIQMGDVLLRFLDS